MSISAVSTSGLTQSFTLGQTSSNKPTSDEIAASIFERDDADGDGLLSLSETPLDESRFGEIDADGDGFISSNELSNNAQQQQEEMGSLMGQLTLQMQGISTSELASSIIDQDDADGDGALSLDETPLDEDMFNEIDADGDGLITAEELSTDMDEKMASGMPTAPPAAEAQAAEVTGTSASSASSASDSSSSSSESEEEYDQYDLNEDGQVTVDELLRAFQMGDSSLGSMFDEMGDSTISAMTQRVAMDAYAAQTM